MSQLPVRMHLAPQVSEVLGLPRKPKVVNAFYEATELDKNGEYAKAARIYDELLNADFDNPVLLAAFGMNYAARERNGLAFTLLTKALDNIEGMVDGFKRLGVVPRVDKIDAMDEFKTNKRSEILNAIGTCYKHENRTELARKFFSEAQSLIPTNPDIQNNLATLNINEGHPERALTNLNLALSINPEHPQARWNKSLVLLEMGDYENGWSLYDAGFPAKVRMERNYSTSPIPQWDGSPGKTLVVYGEQGIGDEIMFASCLPDLLKISKQVVFDCHKKLHTLFHASFPGIDIYPTREDSVIMWPQTPQGEKRYNFDARVAIGSLPQFFRPNLESFPGTSYIKADPVQAQMWKEKLAALGPRPKIGINWIGGHKRTRVEVRSMHLEQLLPILRQDADFISLQYTDCQQEINDFSSKYGIPIHYFPQASHSPNYADTAALVANLDLVITVCSSIVHLAGSMGTPCWVLTPSRPAWRYRLDLDYMPWYSQVSLFRQKPDSVDWAPVVQEVSESLNELLYAIHK